jgi:hypothetical protein
VDVVEGAFRSWHSAWQARFYIENDGECGPIMPEYNSPLQ